MPLVGCDLRLWLSAAAGGWSVADPDGGHVPVDWGTNLGSDWLALGWRLLLKTDGRSSLVSLWPELKNISSETIKLLLEVLWIVCRFVRDQTIRKLQSKHQLQRVETYLLELQCQTPPLHLEAHICPLCIRSVQSQSSLVRDAYIQNWWWKAIFFSDSMLYQIERFYLHICACRKFFLNEWYWWRRCYHERCFVPPWQWVFLQRVQSFHPAVMLKTQNKTPSFTNRGSASLVQKENEMAEI